MFIEIAAPAVIVLEQQLCWGVEYTWSRVYREATGRKRASGPAYSRQRRANLCVCVNATVKDTPPIACTEHQPAPALM